MRIVLDTNVLIAAFISRGACAELFEYSINNHKIYLSYWLNEEFRKVLLEKFKVDSELVESAISIITPIAILVEPIPLDVPICRDKDDDNVLALALAGKVDCIITGDNDLLVLKEYKGIPIIKPANFWEFEADYLK